MFVRAPVPSCKPAASALSARARLVSASPAHVTVATRGVGCRRAVIAVTCAKGGKGQRPSWTEAAAGIGRGRTKGEARAPKPSRKQAQSADPDAQGRIQRAAAASRRSAARTTRRPAADGAADGAADAAADEAVVACAVDAAPARVRAAPSTDDTTAASRIATSSSSSSSAPIATPRSDASVTARNVAAIRATADASASPSWSASGRARRATPNADATDASSSASYTGSGFRLVRCMPHLKRREADDAVSAGRVRVNGELVRPSRRVVSGDVVTLDGRVQDWEAFAEASESSVGAPGSGFAYLKYNKPRGVTCTMEASQRSSMMYALKDEIKALHGARLFPVGRLDRDSSGLVLLTDDGRVPEALLDPERKAPKVYEVDAIPPPTDADIARLAAGVTITTTQQRTMQTTTAPTLPCEVRRIDGRGALRFTLCEGVIDRFGRCARRSARR